VNLTQTKELKDLAGLRVDTVDTKERRIRWRRGEMSKVKLGLEKDSTKRYR